MRAILIAGPTTSGKSERAIDIARKVGGVVVNADSMQVYRELRVLTARPTADQEAAAPHRLYGHVAAGETYSVGSWLDEATAAMRAARAGGGVPVVVGGTGLYFHALEKGIAAVPDIPGPIRDRWRAALAERGAQSLHRELERVSPEEALRLRPSDGQRVVRALEVLEATGEPLAAHQARTAPEGPLEGVAVERILLMPERAELHRRARARLEAMLAKGALEEVERLMQLGLDPRLPCMKAIGVQPFARHLGGEIGLDEALALALAQTRQYIKRQTTWFRNRMPHWPVER